jgi:hypothetical protein
MYSYNKYSFIVTCSALPIYEQLIDQQNSTLKRYGCFWYKDSREIWT